MIDPIEELLQRVDIGLQDLGRRERAEVIEELEHHLDCRVRDYVLNGRDESRARELAANDFGDPLVVADSMIRVKRPGRLFVPSLLTALGFTATLPVLLILMSYGGEFPQNEPLPPRAHWIGLVGILWMFVVSPLVGGVITGLLARSRALATSALGFAGWSLVVAAFVFVFSRDEGEWWAMLSGMLVIGIPFVLVGAFYGRVIRDDRRKSTSPESVDGLPDPSP